MISNAFRNAPQSYAELHTYGGLALVCSAAAIACLLFALGSVLRPRQHRDLRGGAWAAIFVPLAAVIAVTSYRVTRAAETTLPGDTTDGLILTITYSLVLAPFVGAWAARYALLWRRRYLVAR